MVGMAAEPVSLIHDTAIRLEALFVEVDRKLESTSNVG